MTLKPSAVLLAVSLACAGCVSTGIEITSDPVKPRKLRSIPSDQFLRNMVTVVRTYKTEGGKPVEFSGATCTAKSRDVQARFATPIGIETPLYIQGARFKNRGRPAPLTVTCTANGEKATVTAEAFPYGAKNQTSSTAYYNSATGNYAGGTYTTRHNTQLRSSYPWGYGNVITVVFDNTAGE